MKVTKNNWLVPIFDDDGVTIIATGVSNGNLDVVDVPDYVNQNTITSLIRISDGTHKGELALLKEEQSFFQGCGKIISENEAYELCLNVGKQWLIDELNINPVY